VGDVGDVWVYTNDANFMQRWSGTGWQSMQDGTISTAQQAANDAILDALDAQIDATQALEDALAAQGTANNATLDYRYNTATSTISRLSNFTVIHNWSQTPTYTLNSSGWFVGDVAEFVNTRDGYTMTVAATRIYLPDGSYDTSAFITKAGAIRLAKYVSTSGYWMVVPQ
jgi:hypothetical protein